MASEVAESHLVTEKTEQVQTETENTTTEESDDSQIKYVLNKDKQYLTEHGQKLFNAINILLDDQEQLDLTQALFKYQSEYNVFTLVRSCCELFDTPRKKSLMLFMRPVIPIKDRFHYDEYYKLFFPEEFAPGITSIFCDLIPKELLDKTLKKAHEKKILTLEKEKENEAAECLNAIKILEKVNSDLNKDIQHLMSKSGQEAEQMLSANPPNIHLKRIDDLLAQNHEDLESPKALQIAGFRIIEISPAEDESLGFDVCMGPTGTFIMISYVEPDSLVDKLGMKPGDELVSVNEVSFKMIELDQAVEILSTEATMRIVLQTSGFLPELKDEVEVTASGTYFDNQWYNPFGLETSPPAASKETLKRLIRRISISPKSTKGLGLQIRGGIEYSLGIFISKVLPHSDAAMAGLRVSDQIIEVNGQTFSRISQSDAVRAIKISIINYLSNKSPIKMTVRYLGKLPQLLTKQPEDLNTVKEVESNLEDNSVDSLIHLEEDLKQLAKTSTIIKEEDLQNHELIKSKINTHTDCITDEAARSIDSLKVHFDSKHDLNLFRYYLNDYLNSRINIQYFLFLVTNRVLKSFKKLIDSEQLHAVIKIADLPFFENFLETRKELLKVEIEDKKADDSASFVYLMCDDYKKRLETRSVENLTNMQEDDVDFSLHNKSFYKSLDNLVELN